MQSKVVFDQLLSAAAYELFTDMGLSRSGSDGAQSLDCVAVIGFAGEGMRGSLGLGLTSPMREQFTPAGGDVEDWHAELANQLLGRLKNKLLRYSAPIQVALPMVLRGVRLEFAQRSDDLLTATFDHPTGTCVAWLDVKVDEELPLEPCDDPDGAALAEGSEILF